MTRLDVPYISQLINGSGGNNCGPASLAMTLAYRGVIPPTQQAMLQVADIARDGSLNNVGQTGGYVNFQQLAMAAGWYGQSVTWIYSWESVDLSIQNNEPVIILLDNIPLQPRQYPVSPSWNAHHFILLTSDNPAQADPNRYSSDPLSYYVQAPSFYTEESTRQGVANLGAVQAMALQPIDAPIPPQPEPEKIMLMSDWELRNWVLQDLYAWAGIDYNPDAGTAQGWVNALRAGHYLGRPRTGERPYGEGGGVGVWVEFDYGVLVFRFSDGAASWTG
ncbi:MAG: hypothetical protein EHM23_00265 [Acidobacteria bacterium]|jgi:hypothetical protein|nr:MAG: hypothetical protein EHM23_00845 [Acidobacteriota bacterium]RPJ64577.1 MAG: hypothetical protein EHM23_00265 [Acidobacteriota bacterium]